MQHPQTNSSQVSKRRDCARTELGQLRLKLTKPMQARQFKVSKNKQNLLGCSQEITQIHSCIGQIKTKESAMLLAR